MQSVTPLGPNLLELETDRLVLRPLTLDDADLAVAIHTDERVVRYVCDVATPDESMKRLKENDTRRGAGGRLGIWTLTRKDNGEQIGSAVLVPMPVEKDGTDWSLMVDDQFPAVQIEVGYMLLHQAWGQGYATEACQRIVQFGFETTSLPEIVAVTDPENVASQHVLRKCGFSDEGLQRAYATQCSFFRLNRGDWFARQTNTQTPTGPQHADGDPND